MKMEEVNLPEDEIVFSCGYCGCVLGSMNNIIRNELLQLHECFSNCNDVVANYEKKKLYRTETSGNKSTNFNAERAHCSAGPSTSQQSNLENIPPIHTNEDVGWTTNMVKLLINSYNIHKNKFDSPMFHKKKVWNLISNELLTHGVHKNGLKCNEKWRNLKKMYDKVRQENNKTGNTKVSWQFFEDFQNIYWRDPRFEPVATASSTGLLNKRHNDSSESSSGNQESDDCTTPQKRKTCSPGEKQKDRKISAYEIEMRRQKRHEEKLNLKKEMFQWFKDNFKEKEDPS